MATTDREADLEVVLAEVYAILKPLATEGTHGASSPILKAWAVLDAQDWADVVAAHDERVKAEAEAKLDAVREYARTEDFYVHDQNEAHKNGVRAVYAQPLEAILDRRES
jgi:hypothetical protein